MARAELVTAQYPWASRGPQRHTSSNGISLCSKTQSVCKTNVLGQTLWLRLNNKWADHFQSGCAGTPGPYLSIFTDREQRWLWVMTFHGQQWVHKSNAVLKMKDPFLTSQEASCFTSCCLSVLFSYVHTSSFWTRWHQGGEFHFCRVTHWPKGFFKCQAGHFSAVVPALPRKRKSGFACISLGSGSTFQQMLLQLCSATLEEPSQLPLGQSWGFPPLLPKVMVFPGPPQQYIPLIPLCPSNLKPGPSSLLPRTVLPLSCVLSNLNTPMGWSISNRLVDRWSDIKAPCGTDWGKALSYPPAETGVLSW